MLITKSDVIERYTNGVSTTVIAEQAGCTPRYIRQVLTKAGVIDSTRRRPHIYDINVNFFREWSQDMAYVLGFILTDGCITRNTFSIAQKDAAILTKINEAMASNYPVVKRSNGVNDIHTLNISRKSMVADLAALGIGENKSLTVGMPDVPDEYMASFVRGVIDGDGWVHAKGYTMIVTSGSALFSEQLAQVFGHNGFNTKVKKESGHIYRITVSGKDDIKRLGHWLYSADKGVLYLPRKRERFEFHVAA